MATKKAALACPVCGSRNYTKSVSEGKRGERLEINKFCKHCNQYTIHKETKQGGELIEFFTLCKRRDEACFMAFKKTITP